MKEKKIPLRSCVITKEKLPKRELIRVVRTNEGIKVDVTGKLNGRGAYIKKDINVIEKASKENQLSRALQAEIPKEIYAELKEMID
ncbi:MAG: YlxR family protein [Tenericutes bacterium]|nr:YlxR family protein [Bacilli bacterium]MDD4623817.1 YlxR family protein [Bacilli bacterium]NLV90738.1 YlxR family protein [Mycoplasmatota bacterium]